MIRHISSTLCIFILSLLLCCVAFSKEGSNNQILSNKELFLKTINFHMKTTQGPVPIHDPLSRLLLAANANGNNTSYIKWNEGTDPFEKIEIDINPEDNFLEAIDNIFSSVDQRYIIQNNYMVVLPSNKSDDQESTITNAQFSLLLNENFSSSEYGSLLSSIIEKTIKVKFREEDRECLASNSLAPVYSPKTFSAIMKDVINNCNFSLKESGPNYLLSSNTIQQSSAKEQIQNTSNMCAMSKFRLIAFGNNKGTPCTFLEVKNGNAICKDNSVITSYPIDTIDKVEVSCKEKQYVVNGKSAEFSKRINTLNYNKKQYVAERKRQIAMERKRKEEQAKREREARRRKQEKENSSIMAVSARCERECAVTKYSYDRVCHEGCMAQHFLYGR